MGKNQEIIKSDDQFMPQANRIKYFDMVIKSGSGAILTDVEGKKYIDLLASASSTNIGHSHPAVVKAISEQAANLTHYTTAYYGNEPSSNLLKRLSGLAPGDFDKKVALGNSGSDANDALIKFARAFTGRQTIVSFAGSYHGSTYGSLSLSGVSHNMSRKIGPLLPGTVKLPFPDVHKKFPDESAETFVHRTWAEFMDAFENWLPADEVACVLIEPIQGDGGIVPVPYEFMQKLYQFCQENGILFAVDEINQGLGRSGKMWAIEHFDIAPDLMTIGKSLASGLPLSALIGRSEIMDSLDSPAHAFTTAGNPVCAAAAHATLDVILQENLPERSQKLGQIAQRFFENEQKKHDFIGSVRMIGLNGGIDIVKSDGSPDSEATVKIIARLFELGVIMITLRSNILRFQPPLVISENELQAAFDKLSQTFDELENGKLDLPTGNSKIGW